MKKIPIASLFLITACQDQRSGSADAIIAADRYLSAHHIDVSKMEKTVTLSPKRAIVDYHDATPNVMEFQPIVVVERMSNEIIFVHIEQ